MKKIYIPSNLSLLGLIDPEYQDEENLDRLQYIINLIYEQRVLYKNTDEYVPLKALYMRRILGRKTESNGRLNYDEYVKILIDKGVIECDRRYIKNEKSFGYKLTEPYASVRHKEVAITSNSLQNSINSWQLSRLPATKVHKHLYKFLQEIEINYDDALQEVDVLQTQEYNSAKIAIDKLKNKEFFIYNDNFGFRIHTNITNLKSTLRRYITYKTQKLVNIDIANSQPLILLLSLPTSIRCPVDPYFDDIIPDVVMYKRLVENGELYDYLMEHSEENDRGMFKENFFRETFFGRRTSNLFCELFPTIGEQIRRIKKKDYKKLSRIMQRQESKLIISTICRRIMEEHPDTFVLTIHDSILTTRENVNKIRRVMCEEFGKRGLRPKLRVEEY